MIDVDNDYLIIRLKIKFFHHFLLHFYSIECKFTLIFSYNLLTFNYEVYELDSEKSFRIILMNEIEDKKN